MHGLALPIKKPGEQVCVQLQPCLVARCCGGDAVVSVVRSPEQAVVLLTGFQDGEHVASSSSVAA